MQIPVTHAAATTTDADGRYQFSDLPPAAYSVWADAGVSDTNLAPWVSREQTGVKAQPGAPTAAPDLVIGPPATVRVQLVNGETGEPLKLPAGAIVRPSPLPLFEEGSEHQPFHSQTLPVSPDGVFEARLVPRRFRLLAFVSKNSAEQQTIWQTGDDIDTSGTVLSPKLGQTISATVEVFPTARVEEIRARNAAASKLAEEKKWAEAIAAYTALIAEFPKHQRQFLGARSFANHRSGDYSAALTDLEAIFKAAPDDMFVKSRLAHLLAATPVDADRDSRRALEYAQQLVEMARKRGGVDEWMAQMLDVQAIAHADLGEFDKAVELEQEAIKKAYQAQRKEMKARLDLFQAKKPFRLAPPKP